MKKRILFVDDENLVLQGLQRMLRPLRDQWEMEFVTSGPAALARLNQAAFDVLVSDMRMPGMNGAELLDQARRLHPQVVRVILSGYADRDLTMQCVSCAHQYLSKPCDPELLKTTVTRASNPAGLMASERLRQLVGQMSALPSVPVLYTQVVELLNKPEVALEQVAGLIAQDIAMTAKILKLVNSAFFGLRREITNTQEAVGYLGVETIKALVLSLHVFSQYEKRSLGGVGIEAVWHHSLAAAALAREIAHMEGAPLKLADACYSAAVLHDAGKLVLADNYAAQYGQVLRMVQREGFPSHEAEQAVFGANHAEVGGYLLGLWGLPGPMVEAIGAHHQPARVESPAFGPLAAVHAADILAHRQNRGDSSGRAPAVDKKFLAAAGLEDRWTVWQSTLNSAPRS